MILSPPTNRPGWSAAGTKAWKHYRMQERWVEKFVRSYCKRWDVDPDSKEADSWRCMARAYYAGQEIHDRGHSEEVEEPIRYSAYLERPGGGLWCLYTSPAVKP